ncbi:cAMP-dependent protein kinase regulatory subunit [Intoshia linei]|uniref:cAMP-dependent protein kinase regulatory subunit n=1 Tax=Intoshia linei TaxID=1819745 RepID=A0A177B4F6_9BILA|nr:cAMP-dependent protein kinase regulatory subunit [Intoshia linei]
MRTTPFIHLHYNYKATVAIKNIWSKCNADCTYIDFATNIYSTILFNNSKNKRKEKKIVYTQEMVNQAYLKNRRGSISAEGIDPESFANNDFVPVYHEKNDYQRQQILDTIRNILLFKCLNTDEKKTIVSAMFEKKVNAGDTVIEQGEAGDNFYVIYSGRYEVLKSENNDKIVVGSYDSKGSFGELALMYNKPRAATIVAKTNGVLFALDRITFRTIVLKSCWERSKNYQKLLSKVTFLKQLNEIELMQISDALRSVEFKQGNEIIKQGENGTSMFFVESGQVEIYRLCDEKELPLTVCEKNDYFGELALLTSQARAASARAKTDVVLAILDIKAFERLMGPCKDLMKERISNYENVIRAATGNNNFILSK